MYSFDARVRYSECTEHGELSPVALINYLQDCTTFHSEDLGHGIQFMKDHHFAWFIAAWQIRIVRLPRFAEKITVSTNAYEAGSVTSNRNFLIQDADGNDCVLADSIWFTYDTAHKSPCRIPDFEKIYVTGEPKLNLPRTARKIKVPEGGQELESIAVVEQMLDTNHHVNNAQYVAIAAALAQELAPQDMDTIRVQYRKMALLGDILHPWLYHTDRGIIIDLADGEKNSYATIVFEQMAQKAGERA